jgi:hypothetical protein
MQQREARRAESQGRGGNACKARQGAPRQRPKASKERPKERAEAWGSRKRAEVRGPKEGRGQGGRAEG